MPTLVPSLALSAMWTGETINIENDGSVDTGTLGPGASSQPQAIAAAGGSYHCSIHPVMVGSVNQDTTTPPPGQGSY